MKVLIVEDSPAVRELLIELLSEFPEIDVVGQTDDALEATHLYHSLKPEVVILDLRLRRGSGLGVLGTLKKEDPAPAVVVLSGQSSPNYRETCQNLGADYVFRKSDGLEELVKVLAGMAKAGSGN